MRRFRCALSRLDSGNQENRTKPHSSLETLLNIMPAPPAFQFYADDFLAGTYDMSQEDVGAYIRLLCVQWNRGSIPVQPERLSRLAGGVVSQDVLSKFETGEDGQLRNNRLENERAKQLHFRERQRLKGVASGKSRSKTASTAVQPRLNHGSIPVAIRLEPEGNSPISDLRSADQECALPRVRAPRFQKPSREELDLHAAKIGLTADEVDKFVNHYESNGWKVGRNPMKSWPHSLVNWKLNQQTYGNHQQTNRNGAIDRSIGNVGYDPAAPNKAVRVLAEREAAREAERQAAENGVATPLA